VVGEVYAVPILVQCGYVFEGNGIFWVWEYECLSQTFVSVTMRSLNILLGGSFGVRYSDS